jgi:uncharacterized protein YbjQ (UPF0145 family)
MQIVTMDSIPGHVIRSVIGVVDTQVIHAKAVAPGNLASGRQQAWAQLGAHAESLGANAILGFRMETVMATNDFGSWPYATLAYGTAVAAEPTDS